jgi:hypothetical protein
MRELGLSTSASKSGDVLYAAFTGKAALVMTRKGTPASTIHSLIYRVRTEGEEIARQVGTDHGDFVQHQQLGVTQDRLAVEHEARQRGQPVDQGAYKADQEQCR